MTLASLPQHEMLANVRFGSLAAATRSSPNVCFTPESCRGFRRSACPLRAKSGHCGPFLRDKNKPSIGIARGACHETSPS